MPTPKPMTRAQEKRVPKEVIIEEVQDESMREKSPRDRGDFPLQHHEQVPVEVDMIDHGNKAAKDIIKEQQTQIKELQDDLSKGDFMVAFLKQENM